MNRGVKPAKAKVEAKRPAGRKPVATDDARVRALETRLAEALEQQAATSEILRVISASPSDVQPVLDAVAERAARLCKAPFARVLIIDGDVLNAAADFSVGGETPIPVVPVALKRTSISGRAVLDGDIVHLADILPLLDTEFPDARDNAHRTGFRAALAVPLVREAGAYGAIFLWRREPGLFAPDQVALVQTFAQQAAIAIENVRLFKEVNARNGDLAEALEQQEATSEILRAIASSPTDIQPVLETVVRAAARFCGAPDVALLRVDGSVLRGAAAVGAFGEMLIHRSGGIEALEIPLTRESVSGRAAVERRSVHVHDLAAESEDEYPRGRELQRRLGHHTMLAMPLLREGATVGVIDLFRTEVKPFSEKQVELLRTFADQAVIAIENVRLFTELGTRNRDLTVALEQQTATSEILRAISSSPTDVQPVFDVIGENAERLCDADFSVVSKIDGELIQMVALHGMSAEGRASVGSHFPMRVDAETITARTIRRCAVVHIADVLADPDYESKDAALVSGYRSCLGVPMFREGQVTGSIFVARRKPGLFTDSQVQLLQTFADQAVIAIENVRLFTELERRNRDLTEALEQQTATSEILRVISQSPTDVQPVFDTIVAAAHKLCRASSANVFTFDGKLIHLAALVNVDAEYVDALRGFFPRAPGRDTAVTRAIQSRSIVAIPDVANDTEYTMRANPTTGGFRSVLAIPLLREESAIGGIVVGRAEPGPFPDNQVALLQTFADQAVIAIENVRLFKELEARTTQLTRSVGELKALGEIGQAVSSTLDLETVLSTIASHATQLAGMDGGAIYEYDEAREEFHLHTTESYPIELVEALRATPVRKGEGAIGRLAVTGEPVEIRDIMDAGIYQSRVRENLIRLGYRSLLAVPLLREDHLLGGLVVNRKSTGAFAPDVIDLLKTFATQSALAIQNARLFREIGDKSRQLEIASQHKSEFLANMSHELRTPLNAIIGFSEVLVERMFGEINDKQAEYLADILESGRHLLSLINDILDLSKIEAGRMELDLADFDLPGAIDNTMTLVRERAHRRGVTLGRTVDEGVGKIRGDERKVKQVLLNLLSNALKFTPEGGRIDVRADVRDRMIEISVTDTGVGIAPEDLDAVFEEFRQVGSAAKKVEGTGLGLAISRKFIALHGGRIWATSQVGIGSTFAFTLPLTTPQGRSSD
jgi:GAF domain-containing protein